jgi:hypothetical protein
LPILPLFPAWSVDDGLPSRPVECAKIRVFSGASYFIGPFGDPDVRKKIGRIFFLHRKFLTIPGSACSFIGDVGMSALQGNFLVELFKSWVINLSGSFFGILISFLVTGDFFGG